jgi:hypothetical protein
VEPHRLVNEAESDLRLLVYSGSRFILTDWFAPLLRRKRGLHVKFLVHESMTTRQAEMYKALYDEFRSRVMHGRDRFTIRTYESEPDFRMMFVDSNYLVLSHYNAGDDDNVAETDPATYWESPHLVIGCRGRMSGENNFSLYRPFDRLWEQRWHESTEYFACQPDTPSNSNPVKVRRME